MQSVNLSRPVRPPGGIKNSRKVHCVSTASRRLGYRFQSSRQLHCNSYHRSKVLKGSSQSKVLSRGGGSWARWLNGGSVQLSSTPKQPVQMQIGGKHTELWARTTEVGESREDIRSDGCDHFRGLGDSELPVRVCQTLILDPVLSLDDAAQALETAVDDLSEPPFKSGIIRFQVPLPSDITALQWLQGQNQELLPRTYFSQRAPRGDGEAESNDEENHVQDIDSCIFRAVSGVGAAVLFTDSSPFSRKTWAATQRFLSKGAPEIKVYGAMRFNPEEAPATEWRPFGSFYFIIPQVELCESEGCSLLAVTLAWDEALLWTFKAAVESAATALIQISSQVGSQGERRTMQVEHKEHIPDETSWHQSVKKTLEMIGVDELKGSNMGQQWRSDTSNFNETALSKVVMARRTKLHLRDNVDPLLLLACLQDKDPSAYQFCIQLKDGTAFIGSTPERLFARKGLHVASEAVAATRSRGITSFQDLDTGIDLLLSSKDHNEFEIVRESVQRHLEMVCKRVEVESHKRLIKQARVQHLYARFIGKLNSEAGEYDLLSILHPTPAVCGHPQALAREAITSSGSYDHLKLLNHFQLLSSLPNGVESALMFSDYVVSLVRLSLVLQEDFDRGMYAGPVGWFGGDGAEFAVGIRSSLIQCPKLKSDGAVSKLPQGTNIYLYAGVGVVKSSDPSLEWRELELKVSQFEALLRPSLPLEEVVNINALWAKLIVEECCRLGITYFCIAPGSRSSPLAAAASANPRVRCVSCIDERSLAFHAVGYGRGGNKPAAVITSSGTAVSNLLPAVVEASQDCVPMLLLTADRPHELRDSGANQTIDQVKHFGGYVRYHFDLPPADDKVPARMVLTTLDTAIFRAKTTPFGPVHINCPFREPLAGFIEPWNPLCLEGLQRWVSRSSPFTKHVNVNIDRKYGDFGSLVEVVKILKEAERGLLVVGGLHTGEETWAVALLASYIGWPIVPDVLSGLRIGNAFTFGQNKDLQLNVIHHFDQILLSKSVADAISPDVILQIGGRLTSKRLGHFLEASRPKAYILVEEHPFRADPSHVLTHRVQGSTVDFASAVMPKISKMKDPLGFMPWSSQNKSFSQRLQALTEAVEREIDSKLKMGTSITEPFVARVVAASIPPGSTLFLGNSMPIRDVEMYGMGSLEHNQSDEFLGLTAQVAANRGASGIDGVLSTAIGFAAGSTRRVVMFASVSWLGLQTAISGSVRIRQRDIGGFNKQTVQVTLLIGDVSFLHDTNGLTLLKERVGQPPVTVIVVNNEGGGIFSLLPIATTVPAASFSTLWSTQHDVKIVELCRAHRVNHLQVRTKKELEDALVWVMRSPLNWVVEVESNIKNNTNFHRFMQNSVIQTTNRAYQIYSLYTSSSVTGNDKTLEMTNSEFFHYRIPLSAPLPTTSRGGSLKTWREGFIIRLKLRNDVVGVGEVAPLEGLHEESLEDVEEQLHLLMPELKGLSLPPTLALLDGGFSDWLFKILGVQARTLFPSVRCGLEMAALDALATLAGCTLSELLIGCVSHLGLPEAPSGRPREQKKLSSSTRICALVDSEGSAEQVVDAAADLVKQGFCTLKVKVGRRASPLEDVAIVKAIREQVGASVQIRADANRKWTFQQAVDFATGVRDCGLQYLEEPLGAFQDIPRFCKQTRMPVALDETVDEEVSTSNERLQMFATDGVIAVVIKPGRLGGFERAASVADWARTEGMVAVISSAFESSIGLSAYAHLAAYLDEQHLKCSTSVLEQTPQILSVAHGLGTYTWLKEDVVRNRKFEVVPDMGSIVTTLSAVKQQYHFNDKFMTSMDVGGVIESFPVKLSRDKHDFEFRVWDTDGVTSRVDEQTPALLFLHGFLGRGSEWLSIMRTLSSSFRCIAVDLPGHGQTTFDKNRTINGTDSNPVTMESLSDALVSLLEKLKAGEFVPIGYSMGARIALYLALRYRDRVAGIVSISGSPGLEDDLSRTLRAARDAALGETLKEGGLQSFIETWYQQPLWESLRKHPNFEATKKERMEHDDEYALAGILSSLSVGQQPSLWEALGDCSSPALLVVGSHDTKFVEIAHKMCERAGQSSNGTPRFQKGSSKTRQQEEWESEDFRLPLDFLKEFPEANMVVPSLENLPKDEGFAAFFNQEMKKLQLEDSLFLEAEERPTDYRPQDQMSNTNEAGGNFRVAKVENSGHAVHLENPWVLVRLLRTFVRQLGDS